MKFVQKCSKKYQERKKEKREKQRGRVRKTERYRRFPHLIHLQALKHHGRVEVELHVFLTSAFDGRKWLASRSSQFIPGKEPPVASG
jgi:hypothetical protein